MISFVKFNNILVVILVIILHSTDAFNFNPFSSISYNRRGNPITPILNPFLRSPYKSCSDNVNGLMKKVEVIPCESETICPLVKGTNVTLDVEFISNINSSTLIGSLYGQFNSMFPIPAVKFGQPENLCMSNQVECPIKSGQTYHYRTTVFVKPTFPRIKLNTKVLIQGDKNQDIACALIPVEIIAAAKPK